MKAIFTSINAARTAILAKDGDGNRVSVVRESGEQLDDQHHAAARALCKKMGWKGELAGGHVLKNGATVARVWVWVNNPQSMRLTID